MVVVCGEASEWVGRLLAIILGSRLGWRIE